MLFLLFRNIFNKNIALAYSSPPILYIKINFVTAKPKNKDKEKQIYK